MLGKKNLILKNPKRLYLSDTLQLQRSNKCDLVNIEDNTDVICENMIQQNIGSQDCKNRETIYSNQKIYFH